MNNLSPPSKVDTIVKCFEDLDREDYGHLCIEDYTLAGSSVLCFADWDDNRCTSCTHVENLCFDGKWKSGYQLQCSNLFSNIRAMTVCGDQISYHTRGSTSRGHLLVSVMFALVAVRAIMALYSRRSTTEQPYQSLPRSDSSSAVASEEVTTELTSVPKHHNMKTNAVVV